MAELEYSPADALPWHRRRRNQRRIALVVAAVGLLVLWKATPSVRDRLWLYGLQAKAGTVTLPHGQAVLSTRSTASASQLDSIAAEHLRSWNSTNSSQPTIPLDATLLFSTLHTLEGDERLMQISGTIRPIAGGQQRVEFTMIAFRPRGLSWVLWRTGSEQRGLDMSNLTVDLLPSETLDVFPGKIDPADATHIIVPYTLNGAADQFDLRFVRDASGRASPPAIGLAVQKGGKLLDRGWGQGNAVQLTPPP